MKRLNKHLSTISAEHQQTGKASLMTHVVLGYPTMEKSLEIVRTMSDLGIKLIELQIPFSDPIADGPTIMEANQLALNNGVTPQQCLRAIALLRPQVKASLLLMTYFNIPFSFAGGVAEFCQQAAALEIDGLIIPDYPLNEPSEGLVDCARDNSLFFVPIVSPLSPVSRLQKIAAATSPGGFVYCVSTTGTTGVRNSLPPDLESYLHRVRASFNRPLALGFGISTAEQIKAIGAYAEIAVIGSATIEHLRKSDENGQIKAVSLFLSSLGLGE